MYPDPNQPQAPNPPTNPNTMSNPGLGAVPPSAINPGAPSPMSPIPTASAPSNKPNKTVIIILGIVLGLAACVGIFFAVKALLPSGGSSGNNSSSRSGSSSSYNKEDTKSVAFDAYTVSIPSSFESRTSGSKFYFGPNDGSIIASIKITDFDYQKTKQTRMNMDDEDYKVSVVTLDGKEYTIIEEAYKSGDIVLVGFTQYNSGCIDIEVRRGNSENASIEDLKDFFEEYVSPVINSIK